MGPSGSGKTSLLNIIACRLTVSPGCYFTGVLECNGNSLHKENFGIFGSYVQQDDILIETMTPKELLTFAVNMKLGHLNSQQKKKKVDEMLLRLKLVKC